jgi:DNA-binding MarR family transcriptional regulator
MTTGIRDIDYQSLAAFRYGLRKFLRFSKEYLADHADLTPEQYEALLALKAFAPKSGLLVGELSERLQVKHHTAVSLTDKLARRRLVTRTRDTTDRRKVYVQLTRSGSALVSRVVVFHRNVLRQLAPELIAALRAVQD